jgi:hypothetical protein
MNIILFLIFILYWGGGYITESGYLKKTTSTPDSAVASKIIYPPKILFYLCGAPKSSIKPDGAMSIGSFRAQIMGASAGIYGLAISFWTPPNLTVLLLSLGVTVVTPYVIVYFVDSHKP